MIVLSPGVSPATYLLYVSRFSVAEIPHLLAGVGFRLHRSHIPSDCVVLNPGQR